MTGFQVDPDALLDAAEGVSSATDMLRQKDISSIDPSTAHVGDDDLAHAMSDFTERWQVGVQNMIKDGDEFTQRLKDTYTAYTGVDESVAETIRNLGGTQ